MAPCICTTFNAQYVDEKLRKRTFINVSSVDRIEQHVPMSIRKKSSTVIEQPPRMCKNNNSKLVVSRP